MLSDTPTTNEIATRSMKFDIALDNNRYPEKIGTTSTLEHLYPGASSKHNIRKRGIVRVTGQIPIYSIGKVGDT